MHPRARLLGILHGPSLLRVSLVEEVSQAEWMFDEPPRTQKITVHIYGFTRA